MLKNIVLFITVVLLLGCTQEQPAQATGTSGSETTTAQSTQSTPKTAAHLLVFFINPNGGPCRMQERILDQMSAELEGKVLIRPVKTTVSADQDLFYAYGIRALPLIILTDATGKEIKRLPPGVHPAESIRFLLNYIPKD